MSPNIVDGVTNDVITGTTVGQQTIITYTVANTGGANLAVGSVSILAPSGCTVSQLSSPSSTVVASGTTNFNLGITPTQANWTFNISIPNNDSNEDPYNWIISGVASAAPEISVSRNNTVIGTTDIVSGTSISSQTFVTYVITNTASGQLLLGAATLANNNGCATSISSQPASVLNQNEQTTLIISLTPAQQNWSFSASIPSNDQDESIYTISISGTAVGISGLMLTSVDAPNVGIQFPPFGFELVNNINNPYTRHYTLANTTNNVCTITTFNTVARDCTSGVISPGPPSNVPANSNIPAAIDIFNEGADHSCEINMSTTFGNYIWVISNASSLYADINIDRLITGANVYAGVASMPVANTDNIYGTQIGVPHDTTYYIRNIGTGPLNLSGSPPVSIINQTGCTASVIAQPPTSIRVMPQPFTVSILPSAANWAFTISIQSNAGENPCNVVVTGTTSNGSYLLVNYKAGPNAPIHNYGVRILHGGITTSTGTISRWQYINTGNIILNTPTATNAWVTPVNNCTVLGVFGDAQTIAPYNRTAQEAGAGLVVVTSAISAGNHSYSVTVPSDAANNPFTWTTTVPA